MREALVSLRLGLQMIYRNPSDVPVTIKVDGYLIRLDPWRQAEARVIDGCGKKKGFCLVVTTIQEEKL